MKRWLTLALGGCLLGAVLWAQTPDAVQVRTLLAEQLQKEAPRVLLYAEGTVIRRVWGVPFGYGSSPVDSALAFVARYSGLFTPGASELVLSGTQEVMPPRFTAVYFQQRVQDIPVDRGELTLLVRNAPDYPLVLASSAVRFVEPISLKPSLTAEQVSERVRKLRPDLHQETKPELVVYPGEERTHLAWALTVDARRLEQPERYRVFIDAHTGIPLEWRSEVYFVDITGRVQGYATPGLRPDHSQNPPVLQPLPQLRVTLVGGTSVLTNPEGFFTLPFSGTDQATVQANLNGPWVQVANQAGTTLALEQTVTPPGPADFIFNTERVEFNTAQVNGFLHTTIVHDFAKAINPSYPGIDYAVPCNVNINNSCNAYYTNRTINFYRAGGGCVNTAYSTVIYHEYGHFIIAMGHPNASGSYHEGMADTTAALLTADPCLAIEFRGMGTGCLRNAVNNVTHPCSGGSHYCGQVLSGAFWQTYLAMRQRYSSNPAFALQKVREWYLNSILLRPSGISPQITIDVLTLDDDDGDIYNGTPHYFQINEGFSRHNMPAPQIDWLRIEPLQQPEAIVAPPQGTQLPLMRFIVRVSELVGQVSRSGVFLRYSVNGGAFQQLPMRWMNGDRFIAAVPVPACGSTVRYYIEAFDTQGRVTYYPRGGQSAARIVLVASGLTTIFEDSAETDLGWTVQNVSLTTGAWTRDIPRGTAQNGLPANPGSDSPDAGSRCFFTGQGSVNGSVGEADVDGGPTYLLSPVINLEGSDALVEYYRWFYNGTTVNDTFFVEVSNNNGASWVRVETVSFTGAENQWVHRSFRIGDYVTPTAQVRLRFGTVDNPNDSICEAGVDQVVIRRVVCP
ncbi:MAG: hypothetical protein NZL85_07100 [Fimbriimonadales bacterium]|nr:hypothetical protein [Fimbriimonadales bacterium]